MIAKLLKDRRNFRKNRKGAAAVAQLALVLLTIILVSFSRNAFFSYAILAMMLAVISVLKADEIAAVIKVVIPVVVFTVLVMLPAVFLGNPRFLLTVTMKVFISVGLIAIYNQFVSWNETTRALRAVHVPATFILILDTTVHFLMILGRVADSLSEAVKLRTVSRVRWNKKGTGGVLGTTYMISEKMSRETTEAMQTRCFTGQYPVLKKHRINLYDMIYFLIAGVEIAAYIFTQLMMK